MKRLALFAFAAVLACPAFAQEAHKATGTVKRIDTTKGAVTIAHGPVPSLKWPSMTMAFKTKDKAMLDKVKPGDKVEFRFVQSGRDYVVTEIK